MIRPLLAAVACCALAPFCPAGEPEFVTYQGNASAEVAWRNAVVLRFGASAPRESFESYQGTLAGGTSDQVTALPALGVVFDSAVPGAYPGVYGFAPQAHTGTNQLANFGGGLAQFADYNMRPAPGRVIYAVGLWQCDPQGDLTLNAYGAGGVHIGTMVAPINNGSGNSFGAFISTVPVTLVVVEGEEGDGWNHLDDLQIITRPAGSHACAADIGRTGGLQGPDGALDNNDFIVFIDFFFAQSPAADRGTTGGVPGADDAFDNNDFVVFIDEFFGGCV